MSGSVADFTVAVRESVKADIAAKTGCATDQIKMRVAAGSVVLTVILPHVAATKLEAAVIDGSLTELGHIRVTAADLVTIDSIRHSQEPSRQIEVDMPPASCTTEQDCSFGEFCKNAGSPTASCAHRPASTASPQLPSHSPSDATQRNSSEHATPVSRDAASAPHDGKIDNPFQHWKTVGIAIAAGVVVALVVAVGLAGWARIKQRRQFPSTEDASDKSALYMPFPPRPQKGPSSV